MLPSKPDLVVRSEDPPAIEGRADLLMGLETPVEHFFVHSSGPVPDVDRQSWRLRVDGLVASPLDLGYADVTSLPASTRRLVLECAGNGRRFFDPPVPGLAWGRAALGQARWTGTRLDSVLDRAGLDADASHVSFHSLGAPAHGASLVRSLSIAEVRERGVLLAWAMNEDELTPAHGFPLRVVVSGWSGHHWTKWLTRIEVGREPASHQTRDDYRDAGGADIRGGRVKALITSPADGSRMRDRVLRLSGISWAGESDVAGVDVSIDAGATWHAAAMAPHGGNGAWRRWDLHLELPPDVTGEVTVLARATDTSGRTQPALGEWNPGGYLWNGYDRIVVGT